MARLILDHNLSPYLASLLGQAGHVATTALEMRLDTAEDAEVLRIAGLAGLIVVTSDDDFAALHWVGAIAHAGVLIVPEFRREYAPTVARAIAELLDSSGDFAGQLYDWRPLSGWAHLT